MAGNTPQHELERLYNLIQQERLDEAASTLRLIVRSDKDNEDVWWLLANAATDPAEAKEALENVVRLNPNRQDAQNLLAQLTESYPDLIPLSPEAATFNPADIGDPYRPITPTVTLEDDLDDWMTQQPETVAADVDPLDDWLAGDPNTSTSGEFESDWKPEPVAPAPASVSNASDDPFDFGEEDKAPAFASTSQSVPPKFEQPDFHPEGFEGLPLNQPVGTPNPVSANDVPPLDHTGEEEPHRFMPILMALMLVVVAGIAIFYILTNRTSDVVVVTPGTPLPTFMVVVLPTLDPNATLPTSQAAGATETTLPTVASPETPSFVVSATPTTAPIGTEGSGSATFVPGATVDIPTPTPAGTSAATIAPATAPLAESLPKLTENFKTAGFTDANFNVADTVLGKTLTVKICSKPGIDLLRATDKVRDVIATEAAPYRAELEAVGAQIISCSDANTVLYSKVVPIRVATQYAEKKIDARKYRASWINP